jgi:hypothetical protein
VFNEPFNSTTVGVGDVIRIKVYDDDNKLGQSIYSGYVENLKRRIDSDGESIEVTAYGLAALMNTIFTNTSFATDPAIIMSTLLNNFNANYSSPIITFDPIPLFGFNVDFLALEVTTLQALVNLNELVGQVFYVD